MSTELPRRRKRLTGPLRRVLGHRGGATTAEFALVIIPFMVLIFGIIELSMILVVDLELSNATLSLARQFRVGAMVASGSSVTSSSGSVTTLAALKQAVCSRIRLVPNATCLASLQVDLRAQSTFAGQTSPNPFSGSNFSSTSFCFYSGSSGSIVQMRVFYLWPLLNPILLAPIIQTTSVTTSAGTSTGKFFVLTSSEVFRNEPNASSSNNGSGC